MVNADLLKFRELLLSDVEFREKFREAAEKYSGEQDVKTVFEDLLAPFAKQYGLTATYEDFQAFMGAMDTNGDGDLSEDELAQVAGGKNSGIGLCLAFGAGDMFGQVSDSEHGYICEVVGLASICLGVG